MVILFGIKYNVFSATVILRKLNILCIMKIKYYFVRFTLIWISSVISYCGYSQSKYDHSIWDNLLKKHVTNNGKVVYQAMMEERDQLKIYLEYLSQHRPDPVKTARDVRLAFWINAYNAYTVDLILDHFPVSSINDIGPWLQIPFINSVFDQKHIILGGEKMSLNDIEHGIIRKEFEEPRIHFALVCAAISCPPLRTEAYTAEKLDGQLQDQAFRFINDREKNIIKKDHLQISRIFSWYKKDFTQQGTLVDFIDDYTEVDISTDARIDFLKYDWSLNEKEHP